MDKEISNADKLLSELATTGCLIEKIGTILLALQTKRETLEEKIIKRHLKTVAKNYGQLISIGFACLDNHLAVTDNLLDDLSHHLKTMTLSLDHLLKIIAYNLNFLEQYFEHDFANHLLEAGVADQIQNFTDRLRNYQVE